MTLAREYQQMVAAANDSGAKLKVALGQPGANEARTKSLFKAYLSDLTILNMKLVGFQARMPAATQADVEQLRQNIGLEISDVLAILAAPSAAHWQAAVARWVAHVRAVAVAAQLVRADLRLPPA